MVGTTVSHYKVLEKIGQGGMGTVYRAQDTTLDREVAIKVLPEQFTQDPQRLARFEREAKLLASLNHPNIAAIHSFEHADEVHFLVLELVPGETLQERVAKGPLPVEEALEVCRQIAEGVEAAHEKGVIHRDLKPANVKVTPEGKVKILDFGLAKAFEAEPPVTDVSQSPTLTEEMTRAGVILGTAAYMSPEQAKGKPVDKRADIFAFGAVLYELLTGKRAFEGDTITETIAAVLKSEPEWQMLPQSTPWRIQDLLRRCLQKDPHIRLHDIADVRIEVHEALKEPTTVSPMGTDSSVRTPLWRRAVPWGIAGLMGIVWIVTAFRSDAPSQDVMRFSITLSPDEPLKEDTAVAISSDGTRLAFITEKEGGLLNVRTVDQVEPRQIPGSEGASLPFFSPDGQWVGFFANGKLKKVSLTGGDPLTLCDAQVPRGASWGLDDVITFAPLHTEPLYRIPAEGGTPQVLTSLDSQSQETSHRWPEILPGGQSILFGIEVADRDSVDDKLIAVYSLQTGEKKILLKGGGMARYLPTGHLVFTRRGTLMAVPFDLERLEVTGPQVSVLDDLRTTRGGGIGQFDVSLTGSLVYVGEGVGLGSLVWVDRAGKVDSVTDTPRLFDGPRISPDDHRVAVVVNNEGTPNIWLYDLERDALSPFSLQEQNSWPLWTPDGKRLTFASNRGGHQNLFWQEVDGSSTAMQLTTGEYEHIPDSWSPDGQILVFTETHPSTRRDLWTLSEGGDPSPLMAEPHNEWAASFSPDGDWLVYVSDESGQDEVYLRPFPGPGRKWPISTGGGNEPVWSRNGQEIVYRNGNNMMAVTIDRGPPISLGTPRLLFQGQYRISAIQTPAYAVSPDGQRFLMIKEEGQKADHLTVVLNWFEELKRLVPTE